MSIPNIPRQQYKAHIQVNYVITFPDFPESAEYEAPPGFSLQEALTDAEEVLACVLSDRLEKGLTLPEPSPASTEAMIIPQEALVVPRVNEELFMTPAETSEHLSKSTS